MNLSFALDLESPLAVGSVCSETSSELDPVSITCISNVAVCALHAITQLLLNSLFFLEATLLRMFFPDC
ncbi:hypothetical protein V511_11930 [Mesotoga sp. Brook.08.YT.4.2.5.1]|nr:hypothetical protein V511_11930 [Mesotoga sp. Brook.08.YT.4.2.5.1]PVD18162.1 hypothetical protein V512_014940 [Mesotoga sp. Brook.08.105.5.1]RAO96497.1 hypothetical protein M388_13935 [Mesotoga sp. Brook.08.YT.4.2.5.4.]